MALISKMYWMIACGLWFYQYYVGLRPHDGCRCPGAKLAPGHLQPTWWLDCDYAVTWVILRDTDIRLQPLTYWGRDEMDAISQTTFSSAFYWMKTYELRLKFSLKFVPKRPINNIPALVQIMAWRRLGDKPLSELMVVSLLTHICVTRPQWVKQAMFERVREVGNPMVSLLLTGSTSHRVKPLYPPVHS